MVMKMSKPRFSFGKNWKEYISKDLDEARILEAKKSLVKFMHIDNLRGKLFLDIGCGSGLFSLAAYQMGAKVISFDIDTDSVECAKILRAKYKISHEKWKIMHGNVLDKPFMDSIPAADVVYSWGVLHHTGQMWNAMEETIKKVKKDGLLYIAIYNSLNSIFLSSSRWRQIKWLYNKSPSFVKSILVFGYMFLLFCIYTRSNRNIFDEIKNYKSHRGMSWHRDVVDWVGGYPYEYAHVGELFDFFCKKHPFTLLNLNENTGSGCHELLFKRK